MALPLTCAAIATSITLAMGLGMTPSGDAPSHLFQTWLYRHAGFELWNNYWYAGRYEFVTYSVFYYPLAAWFGQVAVLVVSAALLCGSFALISQRAFGRPAARGPSVAFAATAPVIAMVSGIYPFLTGAACAAVALGLLQYGRGRRIPFALAVFATLGCSPLAFALLVAVLAGILLGQARPLAVLRANPVAFGAVVGVFLTGVFMQRAFSTNAWYPYDLQDAAMMLGFGLAGLFVCGASRRAHSLRMLFAAYLGLNLVAFLLKSPIGSNANRLFLLAGMPLLWLAANVGERRRKLVLVPLLAVVMAVQVGPTVRNAYSAWNSEAGEPSYWHPAVQFLERHPVEGYRVEAVSTWGHWDAYYLARIAPLARGWYRQDDFPQNTVLYNDAKLNAATYQAWLRQLGVRFVLLPDTALDYSSLAEAKLLRSGRSGLRLVGQTRHWRFYELPEATPIVSGPSDEQAQLITLTGEKVLFEVSGPGSYTVRVRYSPYWRMTFGTACVTSTPDGMVQVTTAGAGVYRLEVQAGVDRVADAVQSTTPSC
jgi:hypothetical protein